MMANNYLYKDWKLLNQPHIIKSEIEAITLNAGITDYALLIDQNKMQLFVNDEEDFKIIAIGLAPNASPTLDFYPCSKHASKRALKKEAEKFAKAYGKLPLGHHIEFGIDTERKMVTATANNRHNLVRFFGLARKLEEPYMQEYSNSNPAPT